MNPKTGRHMGDRLSQAPEAPFQRVVSVGALWALAVAQPVFDMLGQYPTLLVAHSLQPAGVFLLAALVSGAGAAVFAPLDWTLLRVHPGAHRALYRLTIAVLAGALALPLVKRVHGLQDLGMVATAAVLGVAVAASHARWLFVRRALEFAAVGLVLFPLHMVFFTPVRTLAFPGEREDVRRPAPDGASRPRIVLIIFDELPLVSLLDGDGLIDDVRYPNLAALARHSHWFRNFTVNAPMTEWSLPTIFTGRYQRTESEPTASEHPRSLFALLGPTHDIRTIGDFVAELVPLEYRRGIATPTMAASLASVLSDLSVVYLHVILPPRLGSLLPDVTNAWRDFQAAGPARRDQLPEKRLQFRELSDQVKASPAGTLLVFHSDFVHNPWTFLPSGRRYDAPPMPGYVQDGTSVRRRAGFGGKLWVDDPWLVAQGYQRHLLEVGAADAALGEFLGELRHRSLFDESLIVVMADHGCSFIPGGRNRGDAQTLEADIMPVPFLLKLPWQREGVVSDRNVEAIDVLPTIADALGVPVPWPIDGSSALSRGEAARAQKLVYFKKGFELAVPASGEAKYRSVRTKLDLFGSGKTKPDGLFQLGPYGALVGRRTADLGTQPPDGSRVVFHERSRFDDVPEDPYYAPSYVSGEILADSHRLPSPIHVAVAVNGVIRAVTRSYQEDGAARPRFYAIVPDSAFQRGRNDVSFHFIDESRSGLVLTRVPRAE